MKKVIVLLFFALAFGPAVQGQSTDNSSLGFTRIDVSAGLYTSKDMYTSFQFGNDVIWGKNSTPTVFLSTYFFRHNIVEVGLGLGYQRPYLDDPISQPSPGENVRLELHYYTLMPQVRFNWITSKDQVYELYSSAGFALTFVDERYSNNRGNAFYPIPGIHITGIGVRFGKAVGGFMEIGAGSKGLMSAGISFRL